MSFRMFVAVALFVAAAFYLAIVMPADPPAIGSNYTPGTPSAPAAPGSSYTPGSPSNPPVIGGGYTPGTPSAPSAPGSSYTPGAPSGPPAIGEDTPVAVAATGTVNVSGALTSGQSVTIGGRLYQAIVPDNGSASTIFDDAQGLADAINGLRPEYPIADSNVTATVNGTLVTLTARIAGAAGNAITLAKAGAAITISGATLTGGADVPAPPNAPAAIGASYTPGTPTPPPAIGG